MIFGWKKDKWDGRDYLHPITEEVPNIVDLSQYLPSVRNQGSEGSCVGFGVGVNISAHAKKCGMVVDPSSWFSPRWVYNGARFLGGYLNDEGAYPKDAFEWILKRGCLPENFWPYRIPDNSAPKSSLDVESKKYPILSYYRVTNGIDGICSALASGYFVSIGSPWFGSWMKTDSEGCLAKVTRSDSTVGGHETCLYGYDKTSKYVFGINSWGSSWGKSGHYKMPFQAFEVFKQIGAYDAHYVKVEWKETPQPVPPTPVATSLLRLQKSTDGGQTWIDLAKVEDK